MRYFLFLFYYSSITTFICFLLGALLLAQGCPRVPCRVNYSNETCVVSVGEVFLSCLRDFEECYALEENCFWRPGEGCPEASCAGETGSAVVAGLVALPALAGGVMTGYLLMKCCKERKRSKKYVLEESQEMS